VNRDDATIDDLSEFQTYTGELGWLSLKTRPDITFAVRRLRQAQSKPTKKDWKAVKGVMRYLKGQPDYGVMLWRDHKKGLEIYVDAAHQDHPGAKSTESFIAMYAVAPISWSSRKQSLVAPSSTVPEYCAYDYAIKEGMWLKKLLVALKMMTPDQPIKLFTDSSNGISIVKKDSYNKVTKWLDNRYFFVRDEYSKGVLEMIKVDGKENPADCLTKPLDGADFAESIKMIGIDINSSVAPWHTHSPR
jgi:hypothetical protein